MLAVRMKVTLFEKNTAGRLGSDILALACYLLVP